MFGIRESKGKRKKEKNIKAYWLPLVVEFLLQAYHNISFRLNMCSVSLYIYVFHSM